MASNEIQNAGLTNQYSGCCRVSVIGEDKVSGIASIYSSLISLPDTITVNEDFILGKTRGNTPIYNCFGKLAGRTKGTVTINDQTLDLSMGLDYVYSASNSKFIEVSKNSLQAMIVGDSFVDTNVIKIVGTNGCRNVIPVSTLTDAQYPFYRDTLLITPNSDDGTGKPNLEANTTISAYDDVVTVAFETVHAVSGKKQGVRAANISFGTPTFTEATDQNKFSVSGARLCDVRYIDKYFIDGLTAPDTALSGTKTVYDVNATILASSKAATTTTSGNLLTPAGGHTLSLNDPVVILSNDGETNLVVNTVYYVKAIPTPATTFTVSDTVGGTVVTLSVGSKNITFAKVPTFVSGDVLVTQTAGVLSALVATVAGTTTLAAVPSTVTFGKGCKIFAEKIANGDVLTTQNAYKFVKTAGATGAAVLAATKLMTTGNGTEDYIWRIKDFDFFSGSWVSYVTIA